MEAKQNKVVVVHPTSGYLKNNKITKAGTPIEMTREELESIGPQAAGFMSVEDYEKKKTVDKLNAELEEKAAKQKAEYRSKRIF